MKQIKTIDPAKEIQNITEFITEYFVDNGNKDTKAVIGMSGGKDSTIAAALLCRALGADNVIGVLMPQGTQEDIEDAYQACKVLKIPHLEINIGPACQALYKSIDEIREASCPIEQNSAVATNTPARIRMTTLYAIAAAVGGRVVNTCNFSEDYVGYSTKYGDSAGDFTVLGNYTVTEILQIGHELGLPANLVDKVPTDGMCGKTDEQRLGFTYAELDKYIRNGEQPDYQTLRKIQEAHKASRHKRRAIVLMGPCPNFIRTDAETGETLPEEWEF